MRRFLIVGPARCSVLHASNAAASRVETLLSSWDRWDGCLGSPGASVPMGGAGLVLEVLATMCSVGRAWRLGARR